MVTTGYSARLDVKHVVNRLRWTFYVSSALVAILLISLILRTAGSYNTLVDGWGVDLFELSMGVICLRRYVDNSWRSSKSIARAFPLVLGAACISWALGDVVRTIESLGGVTRRPVPSLADLFYLGFFPLCYVSFMMVVRRGTSRSLVATSLDGLIAGLGAASLAAAFFFGLILSTTGGRALSVATNLTYPVGDLLLLALAVGGLTILPKAYRRFLVIATVAMAANLIGDGFNLIGPSSKIGAVADAMAWPVSLLMLAMATWVQPTNAPVQPTSAEELSSETTAGFTVPALGALASITVLLSATIGHVGKVALGLATGTLLVAGVRLILTVREAQALNSARFRSLIDNAWDIIVVTEADFEIAYITPSSNRVLGYPPSDLEGSPMTDIVHPDEADAMIDQLHQLIDGDTKTAAFQTRMRHQNGQWRTIAWTATNLLVDPSVRGYVLNGSDVTDALETADELASARDGAVKASKAKSEFLSTMSHEIRTPMNGVIGLTDLLLETSLDHDQLELASGVKVSAENLLFIVNDILDFSKIEAGKLNLEQTSLDVAQVADDVGRILAGTAHAKGLELLVEVHPDVPNNLLGDGFRIQQVLLNLASNAVKFTLEGDVLIRVSLLDQDSNSVVLRFEVIDMGIGIAVADQERLFRPFAQADSSTTRKFGGSGLGLAICRQLVELMGGKLSLTSALGNGSTFLFELPLRRDLSEPNVNPSNSPRHLVGRRALVVDDNATNRTILRQQMSFWGIEVSEAVDGYQALGLARAAIQSGQRFDLAVIDLNMPGMDGIELADRLKTDAATAVITLFLLSSSGDRLGAEETHLRGFAGSLTKPVRQSELLNCLLTGLYVGGPHPPAAGSPLDQADDPETPRGTILLVEDNKINQLVLAKTLTRLGFRSDIANHGNEALSAIQARRYDAVMMDCEMPEMDGYEATTEIRRIEGATRHTPIIAMTAAAMSGDRDKCLAAGMDDYITKPVRMATVLAVLERWVVGPAADAGASEPAAGSKDDGFPGPLDQSQIELLRSLDSGEGIVLSNIVDQYLIQTAEGREELIRVVDSGDMVAVERAAHTLRGASANVGACELAAVCAEIERRGGFARLDGVAELVERFDTEFVRVRTALSLLTTRA